MIMMLQWTRCCFYVHKQDASTSTCQSFHSRKVAWIHTKCLSLFQKYIWRDLPLEILDLLRFNVTMHWLVGLKVLSVFPFCRVSYFIQQVFNQTVVSLLLDVSMNEYQTSLLAAWKSNLFLCLEDDFILPLLTLLPFLHSHAHYTKKKHPILLIANLKLFFCLFFFFFFNRARNFFTIPSKQTSVYPP